MNRTPRTAPPPLPLLDRLINEPLPGDQVPRRARMAQDPTAARGLACVRNWCSRDLARLRLEAILRDLEVLLNTRRSLVCLPEAPGELEPLGPRLRSGGGTWLRADLGRSSRELAERDRICDPAVRAPARQCTRRAGGGVRPARAAAAEDRCLAGRRRAGLRSRLRWSPSRGRFELRGDLP